MDNNPLKKFIDRNIRIILFILCIYSLYFILDYYNNKGANIVFILGASLIFFLVMKTIITYFIIPEYIIRAGYPSFFLNILGSIVVYNKILWPQVITGFFIWLLLFRFTNVGEYYKPKRISAMLYKRLPYSKIKIPTFII